MSGNVQQIPNIFSIVCMPVTALISGWERNHYIFSMCRYAQSCAFISVIELPRIPAYYPKSTIFLFSCLFPLSFDHLLHTETIPAFFKIASWNFARNHQKTLFFQFLIQLTNQLVSMTYRNTQHFCEFICSNINLVVFCHIYILLFFS